MYPHVSCENPVCEAPLSPPPGQSTVRGAGASPVEDDVQHSQQQIHLRGPDQPQSGPVQPALLGPEDLQQARLCRRLQQHVGLLGPVQQGSDDGHAGNPWQEGLKTSRCFVDLAGSSSRAALHILAVVRGSDGAHQEASEELLERRVTHSPGQDTPGRLHGFH